MLSQQFLVQEQEVSDYDHLVDRDTTNSPTLNDQMATNTTTGGTAESKYDDSAPADDDVVVDANLQQLSKFTKLISPLFLVFGLFSLICTILSIVEVDNAEGWVTFMLVVVATIIFSAIAALVEYICCVL